MYTFSILLVGYAIRFLYDSHSRKRRNKEFADEVCQIMDLPRHLGYFKGGPIHTDVDERGHSIFLHRGHSLKFPKALEANGVEAWNITEREAKIIVQLCWASLHHGDE